MATAGANLTLIQDRLHDGGAIWPRAELLRWFNDGYRQLLAQAQAFVRMLPLDVPGRHTYGISFNWENRHTKGGTFWLPHFTAYGGHREVTTLWEVEHLDKISSPSTSRTGITAQWEWAHVDDADNHFRFGLPKNHERIKRLEYDQKRLLASSVREFDEVDDAWMRRQGEPTWWTVGVGRIRSVEVYEIETEYNQAYDLKDFDKGIPREMSGSRTYAVDLERRIFNNFAYTTKGDSDAINITGMSFAPATAYTNTWEKTSGHTTLPDYNFTINLTMNLPDMEYVVVHPWEYAEVSGPTLDSDASGSKRGMFAWEWHSAEGEYGSQDLVVPHADERPGISGLGWRFTKEADTRSDGFTVHNWEKQHLDGDTITADSYPKGTFTWEVHHGTDEVKFGVGTVRSAVSPDRQYLPFVSDATPRALLGGIRDFRGSDDNIVAWETIIPELDLTEDDTPVLIPAPLEKYIRFYVLAQAFGHEGEGSNPALATHYDSRFKRGVALFKRFADTAHKDRLFVREDRDGRRERPPRVRLPSTFERVI